MCINKLELTHFRNLTSINIEPHSCFNIFYGENGSGKTSLLEAIHYLGFGKSFRTHSPSRIIQNGAAHFSVFTLLQQGNTPIPVGIKRSIDGKKQMRLNGEDIHSLSRIVKCLPIQLISTESYRFFHDGPKIRRQFLDWGVFHVKPEFHALWRCLQKVLKQRNSAIKKHSSIKEIIVWDEELCATGNAIDLLRTEFIREFTPIFKKLFSSFIPNYECGIHYQRGWPKEIALLEVLKSAIYKDMQLGYTQFGPQRADMQIYVDKIPVQDFLSQGQQKLAAYALHLTQGQLFQETLNRSPIYLIDDLPSELDPSKRDLITSTLQKLQSQVFITGITRADLREILTLKKASVFHVKHGSIIAV